MDVQTLDAKLRKRAQEKLRSEIHSILDGANTRLRALGNYPTHAKSGLQRVGEEKNDLDCYDVLRIIEEPIYKRIVNEWEQREINAFIADLEKLKVSVEELEARAE
jgi:hypothetical protein